MKLREATEKDIPAIIELLKLSLGESLMPKSEDYWKWKHINNPFGKSPVWLAEENEKLAGVRAFLRWDWMKGKECIKTLRAVDTATHPDYRGKGIFRKLTMGLVDESIKQGYDFIFNTPNKISKAGYLKMGWENVGRLPVNLWIFRPFSVLGSRLGAKSHAEFITLDEGHKFDLPGKLRQFEIKNETELWHTPYSFDFLKWRYVDVPVITYYGHYDSIANSGIIFRIRTGIYGKELRIVEMFGEITSIKKLIKDVQKFTKADYVSWGDNKTFGRISYKSYKLRIGPEVTVRKLNKGTEDFLNFGKWTPGLGDLELF
ncbi:GNAT family N-acetyltransferase [Fulvivirga ulvae]|uniref:GNAT family N-acetyltransferase n=1 Tax=Fulvivirga ulvae TaxID=2904245 RepID=UPI001F32AA84|nr:GNAT family N-acetyltransferase [Fulvivirga ulvae]UII31648.1 GNAT family N-acetyltransferase [Fulvivirga ulvae]